MKRLLLVAMFLWSVAYGQVCADEDTVRSNAASLITATTARINGTVAHFTSAPTSLQLRYVRVGQTDTATASSAPTTALRNLTGLQPNTQYVYYYKTICGSGTRSQNIGAYTFTTLASTIVYATERSTQFRPYALVDSVLQFGATDTILNRAQNLPSIAYKSSNNTFYGYYPSCTCWRPLAIDSSGIIALLDGKVDSVTVSGDSLFYWKVGVSYGYVLPALANVWLKVGNSSTDTSVNWLGTNDANDLVIKTNGTRRMTVKSNGGLTYSADSTDILFDDIDNFEVTNAGSSILFDGKTGGYSSQVGITSGYSVTIGTYESAVGTHNSAIEVYNELIEITPYSGNITIDTLNNLSAQNSIMGWVSTSGGNRGKIGYLTLSGATISGGVLTPDVTASSTTTFTNKRWTARVGSTTSSATPTINTDNVDVYKLTAQAAAITSFSSNLSGTPADGDILEIQITDNGTARAITWGASFVSTTVTLPTTTTISTTLTVIFQYYTTSSYGNNKWHCTNYY